MNFITDWSGKHLQLMNSASNPNQEPTGEVIAREGHQGNGSGGYQGKNGGRGLPALPAPE